MPPKKATTTTGAGRRGRGKKAAEDDDIDAGAAAAVTAAAAAESEAPAPRASSKRARKPPRVKQKHAQEEEDDEATVAPPPALVAVPKAKRAKKAAVAAREVEVVGGGVGAAAAAAAMHAPPPIPPFPAPFPYSVAMHALPPYPPPPGPYARAYGAAAHGAAMMAMGPGGGGGATAKAGAAEKRPATFRRGNEAFRMRLSRALAQRMFLVDHKDESGAGVGGLGHAFTVLGSTGNAYTVRINALPSCSCPDWQRHQGNQQCKHIIFVYLRVLKLRQDDVVLPQKGLLQSELAEILKRLPRSRAELAGVLASEKAQRAYKAALDGKEPEPEPEPEPKEEQLLGDVDECPICFERINAADAAQRAQLAICHACHRPAGHQECFQMWSQSRRRDGLGVSCVWCRAEWAEAGSPPKPKKIVPDEGYINLSEFTGQSPKRDTSTYYSRGRGRGRYGYMWGGDDTMAID